MVFIKIKGKEGVEIKSELFSNLDAEYAETLRVVDEILSVGDIIIKYSMRRIITTKTETAISMLKELSLPEHLSFWIKPLNREFSEHELWFESENLSTIFHSYKKLKEEIQKYN